MRASVGPEPDDTIERVPNVTCWHMLPRFQPGGRVPRYAVQRKDGGQPFSLRLVWSRCGRPAPEPAVGVLPAVVRVANSSRAGTSSLRMVFFPTPFVVAQTGAVLTAFILRPRSRKLLRRALGTTSSPHASNL